jgi:hypothetical protein
MENEDAGKLRLVYSEMTDGELLSLAVDTSPLTEAARYVLADELRRRGLGENAAVQFRQEQGRTRSREARRKRLAWLRVQQYIVKLVLSPILFVALVYWGLGWILRHVFGLSRTQATPYAAFVALAIVPITGFVAIWVILRNERRRKKAHRERAEQSGEQQS